MTEEKDTHIDFIAKVHETLSETDTLIDMMKVTHEVLKDVPGIPEESLTFSVKLIENMITLKVLVRELLEHSANMNDEMEKFVKELEARIKKK